MTAITPIILMPILEKHTILSMVTLEVKYFQNEDIDPIAKVWLQIETDGVEYALNVSKYLLEHSTIQDKIQEIMNNEIEDDDDEDGKWYKSSETVDEEVELEFEAYVDKINKEVYLQRFEGTEIKHLEITEYLSSDELDELF